MYIDCKWDWTMDILYIARKSGYLKQLFVLYGAVA